MMAHNSINIKSIESTIFQALLLSYAFGIGWGVLSKESLVVVGLACASCCGLMIWRRHKKVTVFFGALLLMCAGYFYAHIRLQEWQVFTFEREITGIAWIRESPESKDHHLDVILQFTECSPAICPSYAVLAQFPAYEHFRYGDELMITCALKNPQSKNEDFDYRMYLALRDISQLCTPKQWRITRENYQGSVIMRSILSFRHALENHMDEVVAYPESGLIKGLLFGGGSYLTKDMQSIFSKTGMSHIVAVSGANVVIIAESIFYCALMCGFWRKQAFFIAGIGIVCFVAMVGASASALRAGIMGGLVVIAHLSSRKSSGLRLWTLALVCMLTWQPLALVYDIGFQLSFLATLSLLLCSPITRFVLGYASNRVVKFFGEIICTSLCVEAFVLPIIFYHFHVFSTVSLVANILVLPLISIAMLSGFMSSIMVSISYPLAYVSGLMTYVILHYMMIVIQFLGSLSYATMDVGAFEVFHMLVWYCVVGMLILYFRNKVALLG